MTTIRIDGKPIQQGSMRAFNNRIIHTKTKELLEWRGKIAAEARRAGLRPTADAVGVYMDFEYERPKTVKRAMPTVPPDLDKQVRSILDALKGVAYVDDGQVVEIVATKKYGNPGVTLTIKNVSQPT